jgi:hypothetical protein
MPRKMPGYKPCGRENSHQLLKWLEGLANDKLELHVAYVFKVGREWRKVIGIVPLP